MAVVVQWIKNLIFIILFTALLEMFLPENALRKYVRVVMGFFVISILISPLTLIFKQDFSGIHNIMPEGHISLDWEEIEKRGSNLNDANQALLLDYYQKKIGERVREIIKLEYSDFKEDIQVTLDDNYGINNLKIILIDKGIENIEIAPVKINENINDGEETTGEMFQKNYNSEKLRYNLAQVFQISQEKIEVYFKAGGR